MKRFVSALLAVCLLLSVVPFAYADNVLINGAWSYVKAGANAKIVKYSGTDTVVTVPSKIGNLTVKEIGGDVFSETPAVTVNLPTSVLTIGDNAFSGSETLANVFIFGTTTTISDTAFDNVISDFTVYTKANSPTSKYCTEKSIKWVNLVSAGLVYLGVNESTLAVKFAPGAVLKSRNANVTVDKSGKLTGKKVGTAVVDVSLPNGIAGYLNVKVFKAPTKIGNIPASLSLLEGNTYALKPTRASDEYCNAFSYSSSNNAVATVTSAGVISAVSSGKTVITVKTYNGVAAKVNLTIGTEAESIAFGKSEYKVSVGQLISTSYVFPANQISEKVTYATSNVSIVGINSKGEIKGFKTGTAVITVKTAKGVTGTAKVTVVAAPTGISLNKSSMTIGVGEKIKLTAKIAGGTGTEKITWIAVNGHAAVDKNGYVTGKTVGAVNIYAKLSNGKNAKCLINVKKAPGSLGLNAKSLTLGIGETFDINSVLPAGTASYSIKLNQSNPDTISVAPYFIIKALKPGVNTLTFKTFNGKTAVCKVTVKAAPSAVIHNPSTVQLPGKKTYQLKPTVNSGAGCTKFTYKSSNPSVFGITATGKIVAYKNGRGNAYIYAYNHTASHPVYTKVLVEVKGLAIKISSFTTSFQGAPYGKRTNLRVACKYINGTSGGYVLMPGETFSFNKAVGARTSSRGFVDGLVVAGNGYVEGIGGGICQAATTIFNAALLANTAIVERHNHSLRSSYVAVGRDATVSWGVQDLKFRNPFKTPIKLTMTYNESGYITATIYSMTNLTIPKIKITTARSGKGYVCKRYSNGRVNYTCYSYYNN